MEKWLRLIMLALLLAWSLSTQAAEAPTTMLTDPGEQTTLKNVRIEGSLDLETGVPIRWKKPDGSGYVNIVTLDKNGTLRLCDDPFYYDASISDDEHGKKRVIEVRNPNTRFPDFLLPITRNSKDPRQGKAENADSKLALRSIILTETNDPAELNLIRIGDDAGPPAVKNETGSVVSGGVGGLIRWMAMRGNLGITTDAEMIVRGFGGFKKGDHYGAVIFQIPDDRYPDEKWSPLLVMKPGVRIGGIRGAAGSVTGGMLEVDSFDDRPVVLRRTKGGGLPVSLALATGEPGTVADATNSMALFKASAESRPGTGTAAANADPGAMTSRLEIQTNKGSRLETDWVLPIPAAQVSRSAGQTIPSGQLVALAFDQKLHDTDAIHQPSQTTRLTCRTAGRYAIGASVEFAANGKGTRQVIIRRNGQESVAAVRAPGIDGESTQITFTAPPIDLKPGDYIELMVRQTSGQDLEVPKGEIPLKLDMTRVG